MRSLSPWRRQPISTRPAGVYLMALDTRFCTSRRSSRRSERTTSEQVTYLSSIPLAAASGENSSSIWRISSSMRKLANSGRMAPVSSRDMSSSAPKISSTASRDASMLSIRRRSSRPPWRSIRLVTSSRAALSGGRMSWRAAARNLVLEILAASHDILQPLNAARLYVTSLIERQSGGEDSRLVENIDDSLEAIEDILGALLDISRLDAGAMTPAITSFKMSDLMRSLEIEFAPIARAKGLQLTLVPCSLPVESDRLLLRRLLQNFVSNAIKYTPRGGVLV